MIKINGNIGEGGGQILRTSLSLGTMTRQPFQINNIRKGRKRPGLMRQHLTCVNAMAEICDARLDGAQVGSDNLIFIPGQVIAGDYHFKIGSAGSTALVLQTILPALMLASGKSQITIEGGTHASFAPPFEFIEKTYLPLINKMGPKIEIELVKRGFYPAGGGIIKVMINPSKSLKELNIIKKSEVINQKLIIISEHLNEKIAIREKNSFLREMIDKDINYEIISDTKSMGPGNIALFGIEFNDFTKIISAIGKQGISSEEIGSRLARRSSAYLKSFNPVCEYLSDQLLLPIALCGKGRFRTGRPSLHFKTNVEVIQKFLKVNIKVNSTNETDYFVEIEKIK